MHIKLKESKTSEYSTRRSNRTCTPEFKIALVVARQYPGDSIAELALQLGMNTNVLHFCSQELRRSGWMLSKTKFTNAVCCMQTKFYIGGIGISDGSCGDPRGVDLSAYGSMEESAGIGINLDNAIEAHADWHKKLRNAASKHEQLDAETIGRDDCCEMGKWLHGAGSSKFGGTPVFVDLIAGHRDLHVEAGKVARVVNQGGDQVEQ